MQSEELSSRESGLTFLVIGLMAYVTLAAFGFTIGIVIPDLEEEFVLTPVLEGLSATAYILGTIVASVFTGLIASKLGADRTLALGTSIMSIASISLSYSPSYVLILSFIFLTGLGAGFLIPAIYVKMGTVLPKSRGFLVGLANGLFTVGGFLGTFVAASLIAASSWRIPFVAYGIAGGLMALTMYYFLRKTGTGRGTTQESAEKVPYKELLINRSVLLMSGSMFSCNFALFTFLTFGAAFLIKAQGLDLESTGLALGIFSAAGGIGAILTGIWSDRFDRIILNLVVNLVAAGSSALLFLQVSPLAVIAILATAFGFGALPFWSLLISAVQDLTEEKGVVTATAISQNIAWVGAMLGPVIAGAMLLYTDFQLVLLVTVSAAFLVGAIFPLAASRERRIAQAS